MLENYSNVKFRLNIYLFVSRLKEWDVQLSKFFLYFFIYFNLNHDFPLFGWLWECKKLLRPPNAITPFSLSASNLSGPFCYPMSSQIASSPVNAFILSPLCLGFDTLPSSDSIKKQNFSSWGSDQIGLLMHFSCILIFLQCTSYLHIDWVFISLHFKDDSL